MNSYDFFNPILKKDSLSTQALNINFEIPKPGFIDKFKWCNNSCDTLISADIGIVDSSYYKIDDIITDGIWCPENTGPHEITHYIVYNGGCIDSISTTTYVEEAPTLSIQDSAIICDYSQGVLVNALGSPGSNILWNYQYTDGSTSKIFYSTGYEIVSANYNYCITTDSIYINSIDQLVSDWPNLINDNSDIYCTGESAKIEITNKNNSIFYTWYDGSHDDKITVTQNQNISITGEIYGCIAKDSLDVFFKDCRESEIFIPNVFSPNNDGINDELEIFGQNIEVQEIKIYNRWGAEMFAAKDQNVKWNGTFKGAEAQIDTYVYFVKYKDLLTGKEEIKKGSVQLVK